MVSHRRINVVEPKGNKMFCCWSVVDVVKTAGIRKQLFACCYDMEEYDKLNVSKPFSIK